MNVAAVKAACASSGVEGGWHSINWAKTHQNVRRLQARIVKATQEKRWGKVNSLQRLLTTSFSGKAMAVRKVTENRGRRTAGVDGETWSTPATKWTGVLSLKRRGYKPLPLRRVHITKANGKTRPLGIPTMKDRAMQALYVLALGPVAETTADPNSYGFRPERSTADAIEQCFKSLASEARGTWVLEGDIKGCFDNIGHDWLIANIPMDKAILQKWLKAGFMEEGTLHPTDAGTPQGGIISPILANMALDGLEGILKEEFKPRKVKGKKVSSYVNFIRYADDFIITGSSKELLEEQVKPIVEAFMLSRGLTLSPEKTLITHINDGFDFLGQNIRKFDGKLIVKPSRKSVKRLLDDVRSHIKANKTISAFGLIRILNPKLKGWASFHRHAVSSATFKWMDQKIWEALWNWAKRRHPNKRLTWIKKKYFCRVKVRDWMFFGSVPGKDGGNVLLHSLFDTKIERHLKIQSEANPYDMRWEQYFEERLFARMENHTLGVGKLWRLWKRQEGVCPVCRTEISEKGWDIHHVVYRVNGGDDRITNLALLHKNCHKQLHVRGFTIALPDSA